MPCSDITELLTLTLDPNDCVSHYSLSKLTCGASVGNPSLLRKWIDGKPSSEILPATVDQVLEVLPTTSETWQFLTFKHLATIQLALQALSGTVDSGLNDLCTIESVEYGPNGTKMTALVKVDLLTSQIKSCGGCSTCGS
jgi:hypothetical protein